MAKPSGKSLRILMVISQYWPCVGGAERQAERLAQELVARGHYVEVLTKPQPNQPDWEARNGVRICRGLRTMPLGKLWGVSYMLSAFWQMWKRRREFDVFHLHQLYLHAASAALVRRVGGPPVLVKLVNSGLFADWLLLQKMMGGGLWFRLAKECDRAVAICRRLEPELREAGFEAKQVVRIPNGVDSDAFMPDPDVKPEPGRILFLGRLDPYKGLFDLLKAMPMLREKCPDAHLHIVGEGPLRDDLVREINERQLEHCVLLRPFTQDVLEEYHRASVVALPSTAEGMSNVMLEAMACGRPVVAARVGGADDLLNPDEDSLAPTLQADAYLVARGGVLLEPESPVALAGALGLLLSDGDLSTQLGSNARCIIEEKFSIRAVADQYVALYREMIRSRQS